MLAIGAQAALGGDLEPAPPLERARQSRARPKTVAPMHCCPGPAATATGDSCSLERPAGEESAMQLLTQLHPRCDTGAE
jgi:hypothetical protein